MFTHSKHETNNSNQLQMYGPKTDSFIMEMYITKWKVLYADSYLFQRILSLLQTFHIVCPARLCYVLPIGVIHPRLEPI